MTARDDEPDDAGHDQPDAIEVAFLPPDLPRPAALGILRTGALEPVLGAEGLDPPLDPADQLAHRAGHHPGRPQLRHQNRLPSGRTAPALSTPTARRCPNWRMCVGQWWV